MSIKKDGDNFKLWLKWVLAHLFSVGIVAAFIVFAFSLSGNETLALIFSSLALISIGVLIGLAQWNILKKYTVGIRWIFVSAIGWPVGLIIGQVIGAGLIARTGGEAVLPLVLAFAGTGIGFMQWIVLRKIVSGSGLWVISNTIAWLISGVVWWNTTTPEGLFGVVGLVIAAVSAGSITGLVLVWLFRDSLNNNEQQS